MWTVFVMGNYFSPLFSDIPTEWRDYGVEITVFSPLLVIYSLYYIILDPIAGILYVPFLTYLWLSANLFYRDNANALLTAAIIHVVAWAFQFIGHGVFEKRAPPLLDNIFQAFLQAPFFVWLEVLFKFGYRKDLQKSLEKQVSRELQRLRGRRGPLPPQAASGNGGSKSPKRKDQ